MSQKVTVAAAHLAPVYLDTKATVDKTCEFIAKAARAGVELVVFPESFIPGFPLWPALSAPIYNHDFFKRFAEQSLHVPGPEILEICTTAKVSQVMVSIGISEATARSVGCLWNSNLLIGSHENDNIPIIKLVSTLVSQFSCRFCHYISVAHVL